jgi:hypothetical protein
MTHNVSFTVDTSSTVSPQQVQQWLLEAMLQGAKQMPFQIGSVGVPNVRCDSYDPYQNETPEQTLKRYNIHPSIVKQYLTRPDGTVRLPSSSEWNEDFGLGYANRLAWERERGEYGSH